LAAGSGGAVADLFNAGVIDVVDAGVPEGFLALFAFSMSPLSRAVRSLATWRHALRK
jgi:hypothetical protein